MSKKPKVFARIPRIKDPQIRVELQRAHAVIALLAFSLILAFISMLIPNAEPNSPLIIVAVVLLALVALFSLVISLSLRRKK